VFQRDVFLTAMCRCYQKVQCVYVSFLEEKEWGLDVSNE